MLGLAGQLDRLQARQQLLEQDAHLHLGQVLAEAEVGAVAEGQLAVGRAVGAELLRVVEHRLVAVAGGVAEHQPVVLGDRAAAHLGVLGGRAHEGLAPAWSSGSPRRPGRGCGAGSAFTLASWSGCSASAHMAPAVDDEVVSWPAVATIT